MIRIAICDDESHELDRANILLRQYALDHQQYDIRTYNFKAPLELLTYITENGGFDVLLLDVYMDGILGTDAARELRDMGDNCQIIFLTTSRNHAVDAFSLNATHYLVKPYAENEFFSAMDKVLVNLAKKDDVYITVKSTDGICRIELNNLVYCEANNHHQSLFMSDGRLIILRKSSIELFELLKKDPCFNKCGSTYIINMDYITQLSPQEVVLSTGAKIPIPNRKYAEFKTLYMDYICMC